MQNTEVRTMLIETSNLTQAVGRRIGSPKNDPDDLEVLAQTLNHLKTLVLTARRWQIEAYQK